MPDFISLLRDIRDRIYVETSERLDLLSEKLDLFTGASVGSVTNIPAIGNEVQPATVEYDGETGEFSFGIPQSPIVDNTGASLIKSDGTVPMDTGYVPANDLDVMTKEGIGNMQLIWEKGDTPDPQQVPWIYGDGLFLIQFSGTTQYIMMPIFASEFYPTIYTPYLRQSATQHWRAMLNASTLKAVESTDNGLNDSGFCESGFQRIWKIRELTEVL